MDVSFLVEAAKVGGAAIGGSGVTAVFGWMTAKTRQQSMAQGAVDRAVKTALDSTTREIERLNGEIERLKASHKEEMDSCRREQADLRREIDRLMSLLGVADYKPRDLRRVSPKNN